MRRSIQEGDIVRLFGNLYNLVPYVGEGKVSCALRNGTFELPTRGVGKHSIPNAVGRVLFERTPSITKQDRKNWNNANRDPHQK